MILPYGNARVGIECARGAFRGVRIVSGRISSETARTLPLLLSRLGASPHDEVHLVLTGLREARSVVIDEPCFTINNPLSRADMKLPAQDILWDQIPLGKNRTLLNAAPTEDIEQELRRIGVNADFAQPISAVGLDTAALIAAAADIPGVAPIIWADESGSWLIERAESTAGGGRAATLRQITSHVPANVRIIVGPLARSRASWAKEAEAGRAGGLDPEYFVAWGATRWNSKAFPWAPRLEPSGRVQARRRKLRHKRTQRLTWFTAASLFLASLILPQPARWRRAAIEGRIESAQARIRIAETAIVNAGAEGVAMAPLGRMLSRDVIAILHAADSMATEINIVEWKAGILSKPFEALNRTRDDYKEASWFRLRAHASESDAALKFYSMALPFASGARIRNVEYMLDQTGPLSFEIVSIAEGGF